MSIEFASEKLDSAMRTLILLDDSLRERLIGAMTHDVGMINANRDLPENLRGDLMEINDLATKHTSYEASINAMNDQEVNELAEKIYLLYGIVEAHATMSINRHEDFNR